MPEENNEQSKILNIDGAISIILSTMPHRNDVVFSVYIEKSGKWRISRVEEILAVEHNYDNEPDEEDEPKQNPFERNYPKLKGYTG